jgi:hypothetical protein
MEVNLFVGQSQIVQLEGWRRSPQGDLGHQEPLGPRAELPTVDTEQQVRSRTTRSLDGGSGRLYVRVGGQA